MQRFCIVYAVSDKILNTVANCFEALSLTSKRAKRKAVFKAATDFCHAIISDLTCHSSYVKLS